MTAFPKVALIGPGAIGTTIAAALFERGRAPMVCGRTAHSALVLRTDEGEIVVPGPVYTDPMAIAAPFDLVFVAVKTTQTEAIAPWLTALCSPDTVVCVLQNGVEQRQQFAPLTGGATVLPSVVWFPAQRDADASVWLRATPRLTLPDLPGAERVQQALAGTRCAVDLAADFTTVAWRKLLQNAVAGLMVLTGRRAGMFAREDITALGLAYLRECLQVARAEGAALSDNVPEEIIAGFHRAPADLSTSILIDRLNGRPLEWEVDDLLAARGYINPLTVMLMLKRWPVAGKHLVLTAASSSCASLLGQWALAMGARSVSGIIRSPQHRARLEQAGIYAILDTDRALMEKVSQHSDLVFDAVGGELANTLLSVLPGSSTLISYGLLSGRPLTQTRGSATVRKFHLREALPTLSVAAWRAAFDEIWQRLPTTSQPPAQRIALNDWRAAIAAAGQPGRGGKILLDFTAG